MLSPDLSKTVASLLSQNEKKGDVGIEIELEGENLPTEAVGWLVKHEGSLRGKNGRVIHEDTGEADVPREYVSRSPVLIASVERAMLNLHSAFRESKAKVQLSDRASTHIHLNMAAETLGTYMAFLMLYAAVEPVLLRLCGAKRNGNLFCVPTYETWDLPTYAATLSNAVNSSDTRYRWPGRGKYCALNVDPLRSYGSVEIRVFPNSVSVDDIVQWAGFMDGMRRVARSMTAPFDLDLHSFGRNPRRLLENVFGRLQFEAICAPHPPETLVLFGLEQSHEIREGFNSLLDWHEPKKKNEKTEKTGTVGLFAAEPVPDWANLLTDQAPHVLAIEDEI